VRDVAAVVLGLVGIMLLSGTLQQRFATATSGFGNGASQFMERFTPSGLGGQFSIGVLLGAVWSPCVGPTLGAASVLAAQGRDLGSVAAVMIAFGLGAALPLVLVSRLSRQMLMRWRGRMMGVGRAGKILLGAASLAVSALILTGFDRVLETMLVEASPAWLTALTTRF
jgi:cytochrome c-type biogenesis protein